ncbi:MAG: hypothetical protein KC713_08315 [Candidatus Omnitrophica bacterium]|nr:hypothetical protein [Candidatus Omnitrophota bacterium]
MSDLSVLYATAASIGFFHTILGVDHYLPFVALQKARRWSLGKTLSFTFFCGLGHVFSSVILGVIGIYFGMVLLRLELFEAFRGDMAAWALLVFGFMYFVWGIRRAIVPKDHKHVHAQNPAGITPWVLFIIFVLGPCEPLIPVLMYPAAKINLMGLVGVTLVFCTVTIATMVSAVALLGCGVRMVVLHPFEKYSHALAGFAIFACGFLIKFAGI